jgi:DNA-binding MarR family transcriptional regulator
MKLLNLVATLNMVRKNYKLESTHLELLNEVVLANKCLDGKVTIMQIIENFPHTSGATTHKNLKILLRKKLLTTVNNPEDGRIKFIKTGAKFTDLSNNLEAV